MDAVVWFGLCRPLWMGRMVGVGICCGVGVTIQNRIFYTKYTNAKRHGNSRPSISNQIILSLVKKHIFMKRYWNVCFDIAPMCYVTIPDPHILVPFKGGLEMSNSQTQKWLSFLFKLRDFKRQSGRRKSLFRDLKTLTVAIFYWDEQWKKTWLVGLYRGFYYPGI